MLILATRKIKIYIYSTGVFQTKMQHLQKDLIIIFWKNESSVIPRSPIVSGILHLYCHQQRQSEKTTSKMFMSVILLVDFLLRFLLLKLFCI